MLDTSSRARTAKTQYQMLLLSLAPRASIHLIDMWSELCRSEPTCREAIDSTVESKSRVQIWSLCMIMLPAGRELSARRDPVALFSLISG